MAKPKVCTHNIDFYIDRNPEAGKEGAEGTTSSSPGCFSSSWFGVSGKALGSETTKTAERGKTTQEPT
jgi:hypothetical protein